MSKGKKQIKAVTYCRVSSSKQVREGHGLVSQDTRCREYAKLKGYEVLASFHDEGVSGSLIDRPKMKEMLDFLSSCTEQVVVIIDDISRLARGLEAHLQLRTAISSVGAKLESPSVEFGEDSDSLLVENLLASVSQHQRQKNAEQVKNRMRARLLNGYWISNPMVGYKYKAVPGHGKMLTRDEPTASILQDALEKFACGRLETQSEFRDYLLSHKSFPRKKDGTIHLQQVKEMLKRALYAGYLSLPSWGIHMQPGKHEALISLETYERIQERLTKQAKAPTRKDLDAEFPLRGFVNCTGCDNPITSCWSRSANGKRYAYYLCQNKGCEFKGKSIPKAKLEKEFDSIMRELQPKKELFSVALSMFEEQWSEKEKLHSQDREKADSRIAEVDKKISKLIERVMITESITLISAYENTIKELEIEKARLSEKSKEFANHIPDFEKTFRTSLNFLSNPYSMWASGDIVQQRNALKMLFSDRIDYTLKKGFRTPPIAEPVRVCKDIEQESYEVVRLP